MDTVWTLDKIAYAIKNNLEAGLKGTANYVFSIDQIRSMVMAKRNAVIKELDEVGVLDYDDVAQELNCIELDCNDLSLCCDHKVGKSVLHFKVPTVSKVLYVGTTDYRNAFKVYEDRGFHYNAYRHSFLAKRSYVWIRHMPDGTHGFLFNPPTLNMKYISIKAIFEDPYQLNKYACCSITEDGRFPAPDHVIDKIIQLITSEYAQYFYKFYGRKPNDQSSIV